MSMSEQPGGRWVPTDVVLGWQRRLPHRQLFLALRGWFYPHQAVAVAVDRELRTVRSWEDRGWLPRSPLYQPGATDMTDLATLPYGVEDVRGRRYAYTLDMLEDLRTIAEECGVLHGRVNLEGSPFTGRVAAAWGIPEPETDEPIIVRPLTPDELANRYRTGHIVDFGRTHHDTRRPLRDW